MKKVYNRLAIANKNNITTSFYKKIYRLILSFGFLLCAAIRRGPGVGFHVAIVKSSVSLLFSGLSFSQIHQLLVFPLDSVRYFEFDFLWRVILKRQSLGTYLDVSSPRLFSFRALNHREFKSALVLNPDKSDLDLTRNIFLASGIGSLCETKAVLVSDLREKPNSFDTIVCISVLEHIPYSDSIDALCTMWDLLKTGGRLLLSVPCAKEGFDEYIDFNEYGILLPDPDGFVFGQRFYDQEMLENQIFRITGNPSEFAVFGEIVSGTFFSAREKMLCSTDYPYWKEAYTISTEYKYFSRVEDLPGLGVIAFEFVKP